MKPETLYEGSKLRLSPSYRFDFQHAKYNTT